MATSCPGSKPVIEGKDIAEVRKKGAEHAKTVHGRATIAAEIAKKVPAIKDKAYRGSWTSEESFEARRPRP